MSDGSVNHQPDGNGGGGGDGGGGKNQKKRTTGCGRRGKRVVLFGIKTAKKDKGDSRGSVSRRRSGCCVCVRRISRLDSCTESPTSDPNSSDFTVDSLRDLIEKSDFLSKECNPHFDLDR